MSAQDSVSSDLNFCRPSEYAERVRDVLERLELLYEPYEAVMWLTSPQSLMRGQRPSELLATPGGTVMVAEHIERLRDGAYI